MTDQQLVNLYHSVAKSNQYNTMQAIFSYGIFYKSHEKQSNEVYKLYRDEMEKKKLAIKEILMSLIFLISDIKHRYG